MKRSWSIRSQVVTLVAAVTLPLATMGVFATVGETRLGARLAEQAALDVAEVTSAGIRQVLTDARETLTGMAARPAVASMDPLRCGPFLTEANHVLPQYMNFFLVDATGRLLCSALPPSAEGTGAADAAWWGVAPGPDGLIVGPPQFGRLSNDWVVVVAVAVPAGDGEPVGYLGAAVHLERLHSLLHAAELPEQSVVTLAHVDGTVVARSSDPESWIGKQLPLLEGGDRHARLGRGLERTSGVDGVDRLWGFHRVPRAEWMVYAGVPTRWVYAQVWKSAAAKALLGVGILVLFGLLAASLYRRITGSLAVLVESTRETAPGGSERIPTDGPSEVVAVAEQFNRMLSERDRAVEQLASSRQRYRSILDNAIIGIYVATRDGRILEANPALARMLGYDSAEDLLKVPMSRFYPRAGERDRIIAQATQGRSSGSSEVEWIRKDGRGLDVRLYWNLIEDPEGGTAFEVLAEDLTERKALEEQFRQAQKLEAVGRLAGGVAHDFNNRLTVIQGQAQMLLLDLPAGSPLRQNVEAILESSERASTLTRQLLTFGRKQITRPRLLDLNEVVSRLGRVLQRLLGEDIRLGVDLTKESASVRADPGEVEQVLLNLCTNARDAMPQGGKLSLSTALRDLHEGDEGPVGLSAGAYVVLTVADTGHGMDEETRQRLFEPFFTTKPAGKGTGLGLSTVYGLVLQSGGHVEVDSTPGGGTTFDVWYPRADGAPRAAPRAADSGTETVHGSETVLVAEDEEAVRGIVVRTLARAGYRVLAAESGEEALRLEEVHAGPIHLLLTDVVMPGMRGPELAEAVRKRRPHARVLLMSGYTEESPVPTNGSCGPSFLSKPFTPDQLLRRIRDLLDA